jgi:hypothetical protein
LPYLHSLMHCVEMNWMAIVVGPSGSGKTQLIRNVAAFAGQRLDEIPMNNAIDASDLLGGFEQIDLGRYFQVLKNTAAEIVQCLMKQQIVDPHMGDMTAMVATWRRLGARSLVTGQQDDLAQTVADFYALKSEFENRMDPLSALMQTMARQLDVFGKLASNQALSVGRLEWIDGALVRAIEHGLWILIDNANLCSPSVLDRLNSLFENDGFLVINERGLVDGQVKLLRPHPDFRLFMTVDPAAGGEISRAMRNRGVELCIVDTDMNSGDFQKALAMKTELADAQFTHGLLDMAKQAQNVLASNGVHQHIDLREVLTAARFSVELLQRGLTAFDVALQYGVKRICIQPRLGSSVDHDMQLATGTGKENEVVLRGLMLDNSALAMTQLSGSLFTTIDTNASKQIRHFIRYYFGLSSPAHAAVRRQLAECMDEHVKFGLEAMERHSLLSQLERRHGEMMQAMGMHVDAAPLDIGFNVDWRPSRILISEPDYERYQAGLRSVMLAVWQMYIQDDVRKHLDATATTKQSKMSLAQLSHAVSTGRVSAAGIPNGRIVGQLVAVLHRCIDAIGTVLSGVVAVDSEAVQSLLFAVEFWWSNMSTATELDLTQLSTVLKMTLKRARNVNIESMHGVSNDLAALSKLIAVEGNVKSMVSLWKHFSAGSIAYSQDAAMLRDEFSQLMISFQKGAHLL